MNLALKLSPEQEAELQELAAAAGIDPEGFVQNLVHEKLRTGVPVRRKKVPFDQWRAEFRAWASKERPTNPNVDDSRESIYD